MSPNSIDVFVNLVLFYILGPAFTFNNSSNMQQYLRMIHQSVTLSIQRPPPPPPPPPPLPVVNPPKKIISVSSLKGNVIPIKSICLYSKMLSELGSNLNEEWETLGRMLNVSEPDMDVIKAKFNDFHMVEEQPVQMLEHWVRKNGSEATVGVLVTAVYNSGLQYWNLLDIIHKYIPEQ